MPRDWSPLRGARLKLRPYFERERRERGELGGEDQCRVLDGGPRVLGPGRGVGRLDTDGDEGPYDRWDDPSFFRALTRNKRDIYVQKRRTCQ